jgi:hypothetical protein
MVQREDEYAPAKRRHEPNDNTAVETLVKPPHSWAGYASEPSGAGPQLLYGAKRRAGEALLPEAPGASTARGFDGLDAARSAPTPTAATPLSAQAAAARHLPATVVKKSQIRERHKPRRVVASLCP